VHAVFQLIVTVIPTFSLFITLRFRFSGTVCLFTFNCSQSKFFVSHTMQCINLKKIHSRWELYRNT